MTDYLTYADYEAVLAQVQPRLTVSPRVGLILGSGLGALADAVEQPAYLPYGEIDGWPRSTVQGHEGRLVNGCLEGVPVLVMQGRAHAYEGYPIDRLGLPIRVMHLLGVEALVVTNAAGGVNPDFTPGDVMVITDHIAFAGMAGLNPLVGPNIETFGPRFPDMTHAYNPEFRQAALEVGAANGINLRQGVYVWVSGPSFETSADIRFLHKVGADAVGMSTVPEVTVARHCGMKVLGFSGISNKANLDGNTSTSHEEVLEAGQVIVPKLLTVIRGVLPRLVSADGDHHCG